MSVPPLPASQRQTPPTSVQLLHQLLRFWRVVRFRWRYVAASLLVVGLLGTLNFCTATRIYQAKAQLLVQQMGPVVVSPTVQPSGQPQGMLPTYERLFTSTRVLEAAVGRLVELPRELRVDLVNNPRESWVHVLRENLAVRSFRLTNVIEISYRSTSPEAAEAVVAAVVAAYVEFMSKNHMSVATDLVSVIETNRAQVEQELEEKELALLQAKQALGDLGLRDASKAMHPLVQRVIRINESLIEAHQARLKLQASLRAVDQAISTGADLRQHLFAVEPMIGREVILAALGLSEQDSETVARLEQTLIDQKAELESLRPVYGERHPKVLRLIDSIQRTQTHLANYQLTVDQRTRRLQSPPVRKMVRDLVAQELQKASSHEHELRNEYDVAQAEAVNLQSKFEEISMMQREVDRLAGFNQTLLNRIDNIDVNGNQADVRVEVVSASEASRTPVSPRPLVVAFVCLIGGLSCGAALVYVADAFDDRFRSADELKDQLQTNVLAMVRQLSAKAESGIESLQVHVSPDAVECEAFRTLRTTLAFVPEELCCVAVSSSEPGDGKTTILANLGVAFAQAGKRTLMIDADLRRPGLTRLMELKGRPGLADVIQGTDELEGLLTQHLVTTAEPLLDVLPSGPRPVDPTGLLSSARFAELLAWAESRYDQVLIDSPPLLVASDAAVVGRVSGGLMLVVQPQKNHRRLVTRAVEEIRASGLNLVGVILNRLTEGGGHAYYGDHYGYGYGYGAGYGTDVEPDSGVEPQTVGSEQEFGSAVVESELNGDVERASSLTLESYRKRAESEHANEPVRPRRVA